MGKLVNSAQLRDHLGVSKATFYRWLKLRVIPKPLNRAGFPKWDLEEVRSYMKTGKPAA